MVTITRCVPWLLIHPHCIHHPPLTPKVLRKSSHHDVCISDSLMRLFISMLSLSPYLCFYPLTVSHPSLQSHDHPLCYLSINPFAAITRSPLPPPPSPPRPPSAPVQCLDNPTSSFSKWLTKPAVSPERLSIIE